MLSECVVCRFVIRMMRLIMMVSMGWCMNRLVSFMVFVFF